MKIKNFKDFINLTKKHTKPSAKDVVICAFSINKDKHAVNLPTYTFKNRKKNCLSHAETRLVKNSKVNELVVVRTSKEFDKLLIAKPCKLCQAYLKNNKVKKVFYSIDMVQYGIFYPQTKKTIIKRFI